MTELTKREEALELARHVIERASTGWARTLAEALLHEAAQREANDEDREIVDWMEGQEFVEVDVNSALCEISATFGGASAKTLREAFKKAMGKTEGGE